jgi:hypothetical protein
VQLVVDVILDILKEERGIDIEDYSHEVPYKDPDGKTVICAGGRIRELSAEETRLYKLGVRNILSTE